MNVTSTESLITRIILVALNHQELFFNSISSLKGMIFPTAEDFIRTAKGMFDGTETN